MSIEKDSKFRGASPSPSLPDVQFSSVKEYVQKLGGNKVIETILIANNGIAAVKCIRSIRKWSYETFGNGKAIQFVAMATPEDLKANAEYIRMADQVEEVPGGSNANNYANVDLIVEIAERRGVQAVWAGWGHASENPRLPDALSRTASKIAFIGPPAGPMRDLGDKIASTIIGQSANVNCVPWSGSSLTVDYSKEGVPQEIFDKACVTNLEEALAVIRNIGYPCMIKASEGGGGKGIRKVTSEAEVEAAFRQVVSEVPGSPVFIMKMLTKCRHLEVQVLGDAYGEAIALYGRDCSVQRRHQKIIEEGPAIVAPRLVWEQMEQAAVRMAKLVGYQGVGTVEYLFEEASSQYYFLELNPRLQVEHPVTELITNVNLPASQLHVAMGIALHRIPQIRRLYRQHDVYGDNPINFETAPRLEPKGHVIAVRITGENPEEGFKPTSGGITELTFRSTSHVWGYFSVGAQGGLHEYADSQFGHVFSHAENREEARKELVIALKELSIRGDINTTVEYLCYLLETPDFKRNHITTAWLDGLIANRSHLQKEQQAKIEQEDNNWIVVICGALFKSYAVASDRYKQFISLLERGQVPARDLLKAEDTVELIFLNVKYIFIVSRAGQNSFTVKLKNKKEGRIEAEVRPLQDGGFLILLDGKSHVCYGTETPAGLKLILDGRTHMFSTEYDPTQMKTTTAGKLVRYLVENGSHVAAGAPYAEMEVMKMYLPLVASESGVIHFVKAEGSVLQPGQTIATMQLDDPSQVRRAQLYDDRLPELRPPYIRGDKAHQLLREAVTAAQRVLDGYVDIPIEQTMDTLFQQLRNPEIPLLEFQESISKIVAKIPKPILEQMSTELQSYKSKVDADRSNARFSGATMRSIIQNYLSQQPKQKQSELQPILQPLLELSEKFLDGLEQHAIDTVSSILKSFLEVEQNYQLARDYVITHFRQKYKSDSKKIFDYEFSHNSLVHKNKLISLLLDKIGEGIRHYTSFLIELSDLAGLEHHHAALKARRMLTRFRLPSLEQRKASMEQELLQHHFEELASTPSPIFDLLTSFFSHSSVEVRNAAVEVYIRRAYRAYEIQELRVGTTDFGCVKVEWSYVPPYGWTAHQKRPASPRSFNDVGSDSPVPRGTGLYPTSSGGGLPRVHTDDNLASLARESTLAPPGAKDEKEALQNGFLVLFENEQALLKNLGHVVHALPPKFGEGEDFTNVLKIAVPERPNDALLSLPDDAFIASFTSLMQPHIGLLRQAKVRRVTVVITRPEQYPRLFTFRERLNFAEHCIYRHIEPPLAYHLELRRLANFDITLFSSENQQIHIYYAQENGVTGPERSACFFARAVIRGGPRVSIADAPSPSQSDAERLVEQAEDVLSECLNAIELARGDARYKNAWNNHIFMKFVPEVVYDPNKVVSIITDMARKYEKRLGRLQVGEVELIGKLRRSSADANSQPTTVRFLITNPTGYRFNIDAYVEVRDARSKTTVLAPLFGSGKLENKEITEPYPVATAIQKRRAQAQFYSTTFVYDFVELFEVSLQRAWTTYLEERKGKTNIAKPRTPLIIESELILDDKGELQEIQRPPGQNNVGMVGWRLNLSTPEYPNGRDVIVIANDITFQSGSFGPQEDVLFKKVSELARREGLPRIYLAANSGARIGLANEVKNSFHVAWNDESNPAKGFKYLYVTDEEYAKLSQTNSVIANKIAPNCWMITDIIGKEDGLGVENLNGSGMIAGETSRAYDEIFTLTFVTGRTVGIGAYLVRLGQRTIQDKGPVILTGASALNKVLGRKVYSSNTQLGGTQIMFANGVSHLIVSDQLEGTFNIVNWLSYVPRKHGEPVPVIDPVDPVDRPIDFVPTKTPYDPRHMLAGSTDASGKWISGFFDKDSFTETLAGWAKTVVCGRARLGGIPMGVIAVETRTVEAVTPADPAISDSHENVMQQAGQVWFPDSAYKTAQAIQDFNKGEELPLIIFANWRGFSGGLRDLFYEILKFGSYIVDNLRQYKQPVFIYIPPFGELRGGAWVVVDPSINPDMMEMYCDENGRGGVLEPSGTIEIKYKDRDLVKTMHRLDTKLKELDEALKQKDKGEDIIKEITKNIQAREAELLPVYEQIAVTFADLHDKPGRMKAKGVINKALEWQSSRQFFYFRVKRRLHEEQLKKAIQRVDPSLTNNQVVAMIQGWLRDTAGPTDNWDDDKHVIAWLTEHQAKLQEKLKALQAKVVNSKVQELTRVDPVAAVAGLAQILSTFTPQQRATLDLDALKKLLA